MNIFMIKVEGRGENAAYSPHLGELSSGCQMMPVDLTSVGHGKFEFEIVKLRAIPDKESIHSVCRFTNLANKIKQNKTKLS